MVENPVAQAANRMVGAVGADAEAEQHVGLFRFLEHRVATEHEALRGLLGKHQERDAAVKLADPHVDDRDGGVLDAGVKVVALHLALGGFPVGVGAAAVVAGGAGVAHDDALHFLHVPAQLGCGFRILDKSIQLVQKVLAAAAGNLNGLLARLGLARDQEVAQTADAKTPAARVIEVAGGNAVFGELGAEAQVARMELGPLAHHVGQFLGNDVLGVLTGRWLARTDLDHHQPLKRAVEVHKGRHGDIEVALAFPEVQVGASALAR